MFISGGFKSNDFASADCTGLRETFFCKCALQRTCGLWRAPKHCASMGHEPLSEVGLSLAGSYPVARSSQFFRDAKTKLKLNYRLPPALRRISTTFKCPLLSAIARADCPLLSLA